MKGNCTHICTLYRFRIFPPFLNTFYDIYFLYKADFNILQCRYVKMPQIQLCHFELLYFSNPRVSSSLTFPFTCFTCFMPKKSLFSCHYIPLQY